MISVESSCYCNRTPITILALQMHCYIQSHYYCITITLNFVFDLLQVGTATEWWWPHPPDSLVLTVNQRYLSFGMRYASGCHQPRLCTMDLCMVLVGLLTKMWSLPACGEVVNECHYLCEWLNPPPNPTILMQSIWQCPVG